jgi:hypothetical protein
MKISFGAYIDTYIRLHQPATKFKLTDYIKEVIAKNADLSDRQIQRMRDLREGELPEAKSLLKLVEAFDDLQMLNPSDICDRLLLPWIVIEKRQAELASSASNKVIENTITIVSGWQKPLALEDDHIIKAMINNLANGFSYTLLYPSIDNFPLEQEQETNPREMVEEWFEDLRRMVEGEWYKQALRNRESKDRSKFDQDLIDFRNKIKEKIRLVFTNQNSNFWFLLPSDYVVLYNIEPKHEDRDVTSRYGVMRVSGIQMPVSLTESETSDLASIYSKGWLYMEKEVYDRLEEAYVKATTKSKTSKNTAKNL